MAGVTLPGSGVTLQALRQELKPITDRMDRLEGKIGCLEKRQGELIDYVLKVILESADTLRKDVRAVSDGLQELRSDLVDRGMLPRPEPDYDPSARVDDAMAQTKEEALLTTEASADPDLAGDIPCG